MIIRFTANIKNGVRLLQNERNKLHQLFLMRQMPLLFGNELFNVW